MLFNATCFYIFNAIKTTDDNSWINIYIKEKVWKLFILKYLNENLIFELRGPTDFFKLN